MSTDRFTVRTVVLALAILVLGLAAAEVFLVVIDKAIPDSIDRVLNIALGALAAMLVKTSSSSEDAQAVNVVNTTSDPVPVDPTA